MKNKFMITISDINGTKQYTLHQLMRKLVWWIIIGVIAIIAFGAIFIKTLSSKIDDLDKKTQQYKQTQKMLVVENSKLQNVKNTLEKKIAHKGQELNAMNEQLSEIEKIIGLKPDISDAFDERLEQAKQKSLQNVHSAKLSIAELTLLNHSVPTGVPLKHYKRITDKFGYRMHPILHERIFHFGIDFATDIGTPVYAPADGVVEYAKKKGGYGNFLLINHPFGFKTGYGHLSKFAVKSGTYVSKGDLVAYTGNSGRSTGPHLHYEVRYLYKWLNPMSFIKWSSKTYLTAMQHERIVNWNELLTQLKQRYGLKTSSIALK